MRWINALVLLANVSVCSAADLARLPPNTWVELNYTTDQPGDDPTEKGHFGAQGWNKIVYDPDGRRVLFYDRWIDKKHGGYTIYGNCLFALDPAAARLTPVKIDHWTKIDTKEGGYRTLALPENDGEPTPAPRHVYHAFEYVSDLKAVFLCNGAVPPFKNWFCWVQLCYDSHHDCFIGKVNDKFYAFDYVPAESR